MLEATATLIVRGNDWGASRLDGMTTSGTGGRTAPRGVTELAVGRHDLYCKTSKKIVHLAVVLFPGEVLVRKLDTEAQAYVLEDEAAEAEYMEAVRNGGMDSALLRMSMLRLIAKRGKLEEVPRARLAQVCDAWNVIQKRCMGGEPADPLFEEVEKLGLAISGLPMSTQAMQTLAMFLHGAIWPVAGTGQFNLGVVLTNLALRILPGHPQLVDLLASLKSHVGLSQEALRLLEATMRRTPFLPSYLGDRLKETYEEIVKTAAERARNA